jgi:hypothetical protein
MKCTVGGAVNPMYGEISSTVAVAIASMYEKANPRAEDVLLLIREIRSHVDLHGPVVHQSFLRELGAYLSSRGYTPHLEYPTSFFGLRRRDSFSSIRKGYIDLLFEKDKLLVGIEFDNGNRLRFRNIEKLLQSNLDMSIGIVHTSSSIPENIHRIKQVMLEQKLYTEFWLLSLQDDFCQRIEMP